jgi:hypothetical protein
MSILAACSISMLGLVMGGEPSQPVEPLPFNQVRALIGKSTDSPEFRAVEAAFSLRLLNRREDYRYFKGERAEIRTNLVYEGAGLVLYAGKRSDLRKRLPEEAPKVERLRVVLKECMEQLQSKWSIWKWKWPPVRTPKTPELAMAEFGHPDSDMLEESHAILGGDARNLLKSTRTLNYSFPWQTYDAFPYVFLFEHGDLVMLEIRPSYHDVKVVKPTPPP